jgi:high-affinity iron transporter
MAFFAVLREGFETAVFLLAAFQSTTTPFASGLGVVLGIACASVLGYLIYRGGVRIDLARFFRITGFVLVLVAAGLVSSAMHSGAEAGWVVFGQAQALDLTWLVEPGSIRASLITGMLGLQPEPTTAEVVGWLLYAIPMSIYVWWPSAPRTRRPEPVVTPHPQEAAR